MQKIQLDDFDQNLPNSMPISVVMEKRPSDHAWIDFSYQAVGVVASDHGRKNNRLTRVHRQAEVEQFLVGGLELKLFVDECESYYHNLMSPQPGCFIVAAEPENLNDMPIPYLVSLSFDEVHAYLEGDEPVYAVDIPPELYKWAEAFILEHYVASKRRKRKLTDWRQRHGQRIILHHDSA